MAGNNSIQQRLQEGIQAAQSGNRATARRLLQEVTAEDPNNERAWIWLATVVDTLNERRDCLEQVLEINPDNDRARQALTQLVRGGQGGDGTQDAARVRQAQQVRVTSTGIQERRGINPVLVVIGVLVLVAIFSAVVLVPVVLDQANGDATPTPTLGVAVVATSGPTNTPLPSITPPNAIQRSLPTLPPTFTPTPTPLPTNTPLPSATPFPLMEMVALLVSQETGEIEPSLFRINGDGSDAVRIGAGYRELTYSLAGDRIAFVRDVVYPGDEEEGTIAGTFPELFVAPADDPAAATQITRLQSGLVASPSFSPEGDELVFVSNLEGSEDLWYITTAGDGVRRLTENEGIIDRDPAWRPVPGSREIVFASDVDSFSAPELYTFELPEPGIEIELTQITAATNSSYDPAWSPLGDEIAFISDRRGDPDIYLMAADGGGPTLLTQSDNDAEDRNPAFTADGRFISFSSNRLDDRFQIYLISLDGDVLERVTANERQDIALIYQPRLLLRITRGN